MLRLEFDEVAAGIGGVPYHSEVGRHAFANAIDFYTRMNLYGGHSDVPPAEHALEHALESRQAHLQTGRGVPHEVNSLINDMANGLYALSMGSFLKNGHGIEGAATLSLRFVSNVVKKVDDNLANKDDKLANNIFVTDKEFDNNSNFILLKPVARRHISDGKGTFVEESLSVDNMQKLYEKYTRRWL